MTDYHAALQAEEIEHQKTRDALKRVSSSYEIQQDIISETLIPSLKTARQDRDLYASRMERYRLAWQNARQRAAAYVEALEDAADERDALRAELKARDET